MPNYPAIAIKLGSFAGVTAIAGAFHYFGLGEHVEGLLGTGLTLLGAGAHALVGHLGVDVVQDVAEHIGGAEGVRGIQNHDLHRLMGESIARILEREAEHAPGDEYGPAYLRSAATAFRNSWMTIELTGPEVAISEAAIPQYFTGDAESIKRAPVLEQAEWVALVEKVAGRAPFGEFKTLDYAAAELREHFAFELWEAAKDAWKKDDLAWPALNLRLLSLILKHAGEAARNSDAAAGELTELRREIKSLTHAIGKAADSAATKIPHDQRPAQEAMLEAIHEYQNDLNTQLSRIEEEVRRGLARVFVELKELKALNRRTPSPRLSDFVWWMPDWQSRHFMGRDLDVIENALKRGPVIALWGMPGVGKSTVAAAYADRCYKSVYRVTWWVQADTESGIRGGLGKLGDRLGWLRADEEVRTDEKAPAGEKDTALTTVLERLAEEGDKILLIYDNAVNEDMIYPYLPHLPRSGSAHVLITSKARNWEEIAEPIEIEVWPHEVGADYLLARLSRSESERAEAFALSERLGGLPLALFVAAAYCSNKGTLLSEFHRLFDEKGLELFGKFSPRAYHNRQTISTAFALVIAEAANLCRAADPLLQHLALLPAGPIPLFLFMESRESFGEPLASLLANDGLKNALGALGEFGLVYREDIPDERSAVPPTPSISLHPLVREIAAERCMGASRDFAIAALIKAVAAIYPDDNYLNLLNTWPRARRLDALALALVADGQIPSGCELLASDLMERVAGYQQACTPEFVRVRALLHRALVIRKSIHGPDHPAIAQILNKSGLLSLAEDDLPAARLLCEEALSMRERVLAPDDPNIGHNHLNLARILLDQGDIPSARDHGNVALSIFKAKPGEGDADVATSLTILGHIDEHDLALAKSRFEQAERIYKETIGTEHPAYASCLLNLAALSEREENLSSARQYIERAVAIYMVTMGPEHRLVANSLSRLASVLERQGDVTMARSKLENALEIKKQWLGPDHPESKLLRKRLESLSEQGSDGAVVAS
jgi:tetratricopeptide (TPR) repeat protein